MYQLNVDKEKNRLIVKLTGRISKEETKQLSNELKQIVMELDDKFDIINDITEFKIGDPNSTSIVKILINFLKNYNPRKVVRITGKSIIGNEQLNRMISSLNPYPIHVVSSMEEAENFLNED